MTSKSQERIPHTHVGTKETGGRADRVTPELGKLVLQSALPFEQNEPRGSGGTVIRRDSAGMADIAEGEERHKDPGSWTDGYRSDERNVKKRLSAKKKKGSIQEGDI